MSIRVAKQISSILSKLSYETYVKISSCMNYNIIKKNLVTVI